MIRFLLLFLWTGHYLLFLLNLFFFSSFLFVEHTQARRLRRAYLTYPVYST